ncbi:putative membrane protein [Dongia mobilis]|uniref:Putative membrane protein n=1 Tax=Dongia mobilis TaxID=578943 RepID=A0A4V6PXK7_9PROT|nr:DUF599 family protein [Dongia mobilis]TDQ86335.1 putative membrane protein [Dongia mobilis]
MTPLDWAALAVFAVCFFGYARIAHLAGRGRNLNAMMHEVRRAWMQRLMIRTDRIVDSALTGHTVNSMSFFSSATILIVAGLIGVLAQADAALALIRRWHFIDAGSAGLFQLKLLGMVILLVLAFFRFTWALRQYNYCCALVGAAPLALNDYPHRTELAEQVAMVYTSALDSFNSGIRCYYFAVAWIAWITGPIPFLGGLVLVMGVLLRRQAISRAARAIQRYVELNPPDNWPPRE